MYLIYDTETTNFVSEKLPATDLKQAHIVQLAWLMLDSEFNERASFKSLISVPQDVYMSAGAYEKHKISVEDARKFGINERNALIAFWNVYDRCSLSIAFNHKFDKSIIALAHKRQFDSACQWENPEFCAMEATTPLCKLPFANARSNYGQKYKWPKLQEAHFHCFNAFFDGAHDALADVRATARVFKWLLDNKHVTV